MDRILPNKAIYNKLKTAAGSPDMAVDGSSTPVTFSFTNTERNCVIARLNVEGSVAALTDINEFLSLTLTNGISVNIKDADGTVIFNFDDIHIKTDAEWALLAGTDNPVTTSANKTRIGVRWTLSKIGAEIVLGKNWTFNVYINDNLSTLAELQMMVQGYYF